MVWLNAQIAPQLAVERGWQTWNVFLTNWGINTGVSGNDINSLLFPNPASQITIPSISAVSIGPQSQIDRCFIGYTPNLDVSSFSTVSGSYNITNQILLSVESPITYGLSAPITVAFDADISTVASYIPDNGSGTPILFNEVGVAAAQVSPLLHLVFYFQATGFVPTRRYPFVRGISFSAAPSTERLQTILPIYGRKQGNVTIRNTSADTIGFRIGLITPPTSTTGVMFERTLATFTGIPLNGVESFVFGSDITDATYMTLYVTATGPATGTGDFRVELTDVPGGGCSCQSGTPT